MRSVWDNIDDPKYAPGTTGPRLPYLYPGKFLLSVKKISHYPSKKNPRDEWFRVDFDIVEGAKNGDTEVSWIVNLSKGEMAMRDVVAFVSALLGEETRINREVMEHLESAEQPATAMLVRCEATNKKTQGGGDFTQTFWSSVEA